MKSEQDAVKTDPVRRTHARPARPEVSRKRILYLSIDIETDGPIVGVHSMLSIGVCGFDIAGNVLYEFERNVMSLEGGLQDEATMKWWAEPEQAGAWAHVSRNREPPKRVFAKLADDVRELRKSFQLVVICSPAAFDWSFVNYYMFKFVGGENPMGRTAKCAVSFSWALSRSINPNTDFSAMLAEWEDPRFGAHKHRALDDARAQGARFVNALREATRNGPDPRIGRKQ